MSWHRFEFRKLWLRPGYEEVLHLYGVSFDWGCGCPSESFFIFYRCSISISRVMEERSLDNVDSVQIHFFGIHAIMKFMLLHVIIRFLLQESWLQIQHFSYVSRFRLSLLRTVSFACNFQEHVCCIVPGFSLTSPQICRTGALCG